MNKNDWRIGRFAAGTAALALPSGVMLSYETGRRYFPIPDSVWIRAMSAAAADRLWLPAKLDPPSKSLVLYAINTLKPATPDNVDCLGTLDDAVKDAQDIWPSLVVYRCGQNRRLLRAISSPGHKVPVDQETHGNAWDSHSLVVFQVSHPAL